MTQPDVSRRAKEMMVKVSRRICTEQFRYKTRRAGSSAPSTLRIITEPPPYRNYTDSLITLPKMAEEPTNAQEKAEVPTNAEDRAQAGALSSLDARGEDDAAVKKEVDAEALGKAMEKLDVKSEVKKKEEVKKAVKVDAKDVGLLV